MMNFLSFSGTVTAINDFPRDVGGRGGCHQLMSVRDHRGDTVNFEISPNTYFVNQEIVRAGDYVTGYYDGNAPAILIYPPQYPALVISKYDPNLNIKVDFFNAALVSADGQLVLNIAPRTQIMLKNGQPFTGDPTNRNLIVTYGVSTRSIPAQTTPDKIIVWC